MGYVVNLVVAGRLAIVIGGGAIAARKVQDLLAAGARVTVVAAQPSAAIRELEAAHRIEGRWRPYEDSDLDDAFVAIAATDDETVNRRVFRDATRRKVLVNVVDRPEYCTFFVPATVRRGDLTIAVSTDGLSPALAGVLREELERDYGSEYAELVQVMADLRRRMIARGWRGDRIRQAVSEIYNDGIAAAIAAGDRARMREIIRSRAGREFDDESA